MIHNTHDRIDPIAEYENTHHDVAMWRFWEFIISANRPRAMLFSSKSVRKWGIGPLKCAALERRRVSSNQAVPRAAVRNWEHPRAERRPVFSFFYSRFQVIPICFFFFFFPNMLNQVIHWIHVVSIEMGFTWFHHWLERGVVFTKGTAKSFWKAMEIANYPTGILWSVQLPQNSFSKFFGIFASLESPGGRRLLSFSASCPGASRLWCNSWELAISIHRWLGVGWDIGSQISARPTIKVICFQIDAGKARCLQSTTDV